MITKFNNLDMVLGTKLQLQILWLITEINQLSIKPLLCMHIYNYNEHKTIKDEDVTLHESKNTDKTWTCVYDDKEEQYYNRLIVEKNNVKIF